MKIKQIFDIQTELEKRCGKRGSLYYLLRKTDSNLDFDILQISAEWVDAIGKQALSDSLAEDLNNYIGGVDDCNRLVPKWLQGLADDFVDTRYNKHPSYFDVTTAYYSLIPYFRWNNSSRAVYTISKGLANSFKEQLEGEVELPFNFESIKHLPYSNFYIDCKAAGYGDNVGAFVSVISHDNAIVFWFSVWNSGNNCITSMTCRYVVQEDGLIKVSLSPEHMTNLSADESLSKKVFPFLLSIIAYMGSEDADIQDSIEKQAKIKNKYKSTVATRKEYQIGYRIGQRLEEARQRYKYLSEHHDGSTKRPHIRKAHWHSFWVGRKNTSERRLTVKWVAETYVNCDSAEMIDIVDRLIDKADKEDSDDRTS